MSRFNSAESAAKTTNLAGGQSFQESPKLELVSILLTSFVKDQFYRSADETLARFTDLIAKIDKKFVAKAAIYARTKYGMRSISHVAAGEIAKFVKGEAWTKDFFDKIIHRPDDMMEILAYYYATGAKNEPNALRKGFAKAFSRFSEYQLAKYRGEGKSVSLIDVANVVHPAHSEIIARLMKGELKSTDTWESKLTEAGKEAESDEEKEELKSAAWRDLVSERKIGYFALLRNLRNIMEQAPDVLPQALELLKDEKLIKQSLVLPFRYVTALDEIVKTNLTGSRDCLIALNQALDISLSNVPKFEGKTLIALDTSSSMQGQPAKIGSLFAAMLFKSNDADLLTFDSGAEYHTMNPLDSTMTIANGIPFHGGSTNFHAIFQEANRSYDRIIILSDMQGWVGYSTPSHTFQEYKKRCGGNPHVYSFDLAGHGTLQFPEPQVYALAGFSEKVFDIMGMLEQDKNALISEIEKVDL